MAVDILLSIALLLISAKIFGEIAERLKISSLVGEVFGGIVVGPLLGWVGPDPLLAQISGFGILLLLFLIGLSARFEELKGHVYPASTIAIFGITLSFIFGFVTGYLLFQNVTIGIVIGASMLSTSTAITIRSIIDLGEFKTRVYKMLISVDIADEVIAVLVLSLLTTYFTVGSVEIWKVFALFFAVMGFFLIILTIGTKIVRKALFLFQRMRDEQMIVALSLVIVFLVSFVSENVGIAGVTGAFLAGMAMSKSNLTEPVIIPKIKTIGYGFFIPLFFAYSAILLDIGAIFNSAFLIILLVLLGALAKLVGCGVFSGYYGFRDRDRTIIGIATVPRGEYSILIAQIALGFAVITAQLYSVIISFVIITIVITPMMLKVFAK